MKHLKAIHLVNNGEVFQVIGIYRIPALVHYDNESDYETALLSESKFYHRELNEAQALAEHHFDDQNAFFDMVSESFLESLAKMRKD